MKKFWTQAKKFYRKDFRYKNQLKQAQNTYYRVIREAKWACWQIFHQQNVVNQKIQLDKNQC